MAFKGNAGKVTVQKERELYTGIIPVRVIAINPTLDQLHKLALTDSPNEPVYITDKTDESGNAYKMLRVDVWVENDSLNIKTKATFFIENRISSSKDTGKVEYINSYGETAWSLPDTVPTERWFKNVNPRLAYRGEGSLMKFLKSWLNSGDTDELSVENWTAIFKGDYSELQELVKLFGKENIVRVMLIVNVNDKGSYFQGVYGRFFARWNNESTTSWTKFLSKLNNRGQKANPVDGFWSINFQKFEPPLPDSAVSSPVAEEPSMAKAKTFF